MPKSNSFLRYYIEIEYTQEEIHKNSKDITHKYKNRYIKKTISINIHKKLYIYKKNCMYKS